MDVDLVVAHGELSIDEIAVVLGEENGRLEVVAGERAHVLQRVEEDDRLELRSAALHAPEDEGAARSFE